MLESKQMTEYVKIRDITLKGSYRCEGICKVFSDEVLQMCVSRFRGILKRILVLSWLFERSLHFPERSSGVVLEWHSSPGWDWCVESRGMHSTRNRVAGCPHTEQSSKKLAVKGRKRIKEKKSKSGKIVRRRKTASAPNSISRSSVRWCWWERRRGDHLAASTSSLGLL